MVKNLQPMVDSLAEDSEDMTLQWLILITCVKINKNNSIYSLDSCAKCT